MNIKLDTVKRFLVGGALVGAMVGSASAGLLGDTVGTRYVGFNDTGVVNSLVGAGEDGNLFNNQFFEYGDFSFSNRSTTQFGGIWAFSGPLSLELSSLDFGSPLTGVTFSTSLTGVSMAFTADSVTFSWNEQTIPGNESGYLSANFNVSAVPEPETYAMMLAGLGLLGFAARRRKAKAAA